MAAPLAAPLAGFVGPSPDPQLCGAASRAQLPIPNVLNKVWVGTSCPPLQDLVSVLTASILLAPDRIDYWRTATWPAGCATAQPLAAKQVAGRELRGPFGLQECYERLGVNLITLNLSDPSTPLAAATRQFRVPQIARLKGLLASDLLRLWALNTRGGYYLDADVFVVDGERLAAWRACDAFVLGMNGPLDLPNISNADALNNGHARRIELLSTEHAVRLSFASPAGS
jgi:hypothetical protein